MNLTERGKLIFSVVLLCTVACAVYANSFSASFHFDDYTSIVENYAVHRFDLTELLKSSRPVLDITFALNYRFGKLDVFGYHLVNLMLHAANGVMVFFLLRRMVRAAGDDGLWLPLASSLFFVSHPIQTQAVTYIVSRSSVLATTFYLLSFLLFFRAFRHEGAGRAWLPFAGAFLSACLGMATKQEAATLPLMLVIADYYFIAGGDWRAMRPRIGAHLLMFATLAIVVYLSLSGIQSSLTFDYAKGADIQQGEAVTSFQYFLTQLHVVPYYIRLLFLPINQNLDYDWPVTRHADMTTAVLFLMLAGLFVSAVALFRRQRLLSFGIVWFFVTISVTSSFFVIYDVIFEHRLYLPSVGFVLVLSVLIRQVFGQGQEARGITVNHLRSADGGGHA